MRRNGHGIVEEERLTHREAADEALVMGLRLAEGVDADSRRYGIEMVDWAAVKRFEDAGLLERDGTRLTATSAGRLVLDSLLGAIAASSPSNSALQHS